MTPEEAAEIRRINERCQSKDPGIDRLFWAFRAAGALPDILAHIDSQAAQIEDQSLLIENNMISMREQAKQIDALEEALISERARGNLYFDEVLDWDGMSDDDLIAMAEAVLRGYDIQVKYSADGEWRPLNPPEISAANLLPDLIAEIKRLRYQESILKNANQDLKDIIEAKDARIAELEAENKMLDASVAVGLDKLTAEANEVISKFHEFNKMIQYQKRLEEAFLKLKAGSLICDSHCRFRTSYEHCDYDGKSCEPYSADYLDRCPFKSEWDAEARAALDRIKEGK